MSTNPRRTPVTRRDGPGNALAPLKTTMVLRKGATFHSPASPPSTESLPFRPPSLPRRSQTNLDDVVDANRRRVALTLESIDKSLNAVTELSPRTVLRDITTSVPQGILEHTIMPKGQDLTERRVLRPRTNRRSAKHHESDSGLGTSLASTHEKVDGKHTNKKHSVKASAITRSAASTSEEVPGLSSKATNRIFEHTLKPLLARKSLKEFHPLILECSKKIQVREIVCLRDVEKTLLLIAPERTQVKELFLEFCITSIRCIQATVEYLSDREQTRPSDLPYTHGYFIDLVEQIHSYAQQLADAKNKTTTGASNEMGVDGSEEIKLHGGFSVNGRPAELVCIKDGSARSLLDGRPVEIEEDAKGMPRFKRSASQQAEDDEEIMRSMARRKKNAPPEEYAPKKCREAGCNKEFKRPCDLTKHEKTHSRPWKCPVASCKYHDYGWPTEKERDRHQNDKHSSNPDFFECHFKPCPYRSKRESNCKQHMEKAHGWTYVRTKTNGKTRDSNAPSTTLPTPQLGNMPTPSDHSGVATPPQEQYPPMFTNIEFPSYAYDALNHIDLPQEIQLDYSPIDNPTPSTDSGLDTSAYQDVTAQEFGMFDDIYSAPVQIPALQNQYAPAAKGVMDFVQHFSAPEYSAPRAAPHFSPNGEGNAMLYTPNSLVDEGFEDFNTDGNDADFILFPDGQMPKMNGLDHTVFDEMPSMVAGYSQPNSQNLFNMDWQTTAYQDFSH